MATAEVQLVVSKGLLSRDGEDGASVAEPLLKSSFAGAAAAARKVISGLFR